MIDDQKHVLPATGVRLVFVNAAVSLGLFAGLVAAYFLFDSRLALAQAADSFADIFTATALFVSLRVAAQPPDEGHPIGHQRAEPIAALVAAVVAGVLAVEVLRDAITALLSGAEPTMAWPLVWMFLLKVGAKAAIAAVASAAHEKRGSPALSALYVDARNDVLVGVLAVLGFFAARYGWLGLDAWLAIPVAVWIGASGVDLARENIGLLMGQAPSETRRDALAKVAAEVPGVRAVTEVHARHHGADLELLVSVVVDPELTMRRAHDIGHAVEARLIAEPDVCHAVAHLEVLDEPPVSRLDQRMAET